MTDEELKQAMAELQEVVRCRCDEAYRDRGLKDPHCECDSADAVKVVADRIEALSIVNAALTADRDKQAGYKEDYRAVYGEACLQLQETEAKLAKAVAFLEEIAVTGDWFISDMNDLIKELKGKNHE